MEKYMLPCLMKKFFGIECFGCGLQRSVLLFAQGEFVAAFKMYPALYPLLLLLGTIVLEQFTRLKYFKEMVWSLGSLTAFFMVGNYMWKHFL
jgi:hypothetical protein